MTTVRLLHSLYAPDPATGTPRQVARQGQRARIDRACLDQQHSAPASVLLARWKKGVRIVLEQTEDVIEDVPLWQLEPVA